MKPIIRAAAVTVALVASLAWAGPDAYQVTGEVVEVNETGIVVLKGKERFEIARGTVETAAKVGQKVKVEYKMTATSIEVKEAPPKKK